VLESGRREVDDADSFEGGVLSVGGEHIGWQGQWLLNNPRYVSREYYARMSTGIIQQNDVLLVKDGATIGKVAIADRLPAPESAVNEHVFLLRFAPAHCAKFYFYYIQSTLAQDQIQLEIRGSAQPGLSAGFRNTVIAPLPPSSEQRAIAAFLDRETQRIDALVEKKERLVKLLQEQRTALISHAVTKGLDPNVRTKESGIEWFGEIPAHWGVLPLKRLATRIDVGIAEAATHAYSDAGIPMVRSTNVKPGFIDVADMLCIEPWFAEKNRSKYLRTGDLVTVRTGNPGTTAVVPSALDKSQCFTLLMTTLKMCHSPEYYCYVLNSQVAIEMLEIEGWGAAQVNISVPILQSLCIPKPPSEEQSAIVAYLNRETRRIDAMVEKVRRSVELLKEYRTALISAAVTGKIDVRGAA
jgi:type I restriction enzyme S subunit